MQPKVDPKNLVWIDLEMTGLDPDKENIIEIATIVTDSELNVLAEGPELVVHQSDNLLAAMDDWNQNQHKKSGLIDRVRASSVTLADAEAQTLEFIKSWCPPNTSPLCGNSIHHDRRFLIRYMPKIHDYLHYRHVDVTSVKALVLRWYKDGQRYMKKNETHRALADIRESIEELRFLREHYFVKSPV